MPTIQKRIFNKALHVLRFPETQLPIARSDLETKSNPNDAPALEDITIRMYETQRFRADRPDIYTNDATPGVPVLAERSHGGTHAICGNGG